LAYSAVGVISSLLSLLAGVLGFTSVVFNINGAKSLGKIRYIYIVIS